MLRLHSLRRLACILPRHAALLARTPSSCAYSTASAPSTFPGEWARKPPPTADSDAVDGGRIEFTIKIPKPIRPADEPLATKRARLLWSVRKRGILECDLLLSTFVDKKRLAAMGAVELEQLDSLLEENDWDVYYWVTMAKETPPEVKAYGFWDDLVEHSKNKRKDILRMPEL
ncbi:succinate dehydrogenase assembly factor 2 [Podochytrium sp. JEL0797]|nr:succinate dehydrogenase assembly factor 2 [Podochytrium sp. JEL0797]